MFLEDVEGQMFADLALTIAIGVSISLLVAITILPTAARYWMRQTPHQAMKSSTWDRLADTLMRLTGSKARQAGWVVGLMPVAVLLMLRKQEPEGMNALFNEPIGWITLAVIAVLMFIAVMLIRKIVNIDI